MKAPKRGLGEKFKAHGHQVMNRSAPAERRGKRPNLEVGEVKKNILEKEGGTENKNHKKKKNGRTNGSREGGTRP